MANLFRMDFRRLFRSRSFYIVLAVAVGLTLMVILLSATMSDPEFLDSMEANGAEVSEYDRQEGAAIREMSQLELTYECLNSGFLLLMGGIGMTLFVHSDFSSGYIKNICFARPRRRDYVFSKILIAGVYSAMLVIVGVLTSIVGPILFRMYPVGNSLLAIFQYAFWLWLPHWAFSLMALVLVLLTRSSTLGIILSIIAGSGLVAALLQQLCQMFGWTPLSEYLLDTVVRQQSVLGLEMPQMIMTLACAVGWGLVYTVGSLFVMEKRDI